MQRTASEATDWGKVRVVLHHFWRETHFGEHYISRLRNAASLHPSLQSLAAWEAASRRAPNFIQDVPWQPWGSVAGFFHGGRR